MHCSINGYTKMRGLRDAFVNADTSYVALVSSGDFLQGDTEEKNMPPTPGTYQAWEAYREPLRLVGTIV